MSERVVKHLWPASDGKFFAEDPEGRRGYLRYEECIVGEDGEMYVSEEVMKGKSWS